MSLKQLLDGLHYFGSSAFDGAPGENRNNNELVFTTSNTPRLTNEDCPHGDACVIDFNYVPVRRCVSGDPHGVNIRDFVNALTFGV